MTEIFSTQRFIHAFPRTSKRHRASKDALESAGITQLRSVFENGIILTPEPFVFPVDHKNTIYDTAPETTVIQRRACFALLSIEDMMGNQKHSDVFGNFAIGLRTNEARKLGILPTIYYYKSDLRDALNIIEGRGISHELLFRLAEIRRILISIAWIEASANPKDQQYFSKEKLRFYDYTVDDEPNIWPMLDKIREREARKAFKLLDSDRPPASSLIGCLDLILSLFQTADSSYERRHLDYYSQREWRLVAAETDGIECIPLSKPHKKTTRAARAFYRAQQETRSDISLEDAFLLVSSGGQKFSEFISDVVVPSTASDEASSIIGSRFLKVSERDGYTHFERPKDAEHKPNH